MTWMLFAVIVMALLFDFVNGWNDSANAIATVVSTRVLSPLVAIIYAAILNFFGALISERVAETIGGGLVDASAVTPNVILTAMIAAAGWVAWCTILGLPISGSHALIGGLIGSTLVHSSMSWDCLQWAGINKVILAMFVSPVLGFIGGFVLLVLIYWTTYRMTRKTVMAIFKPLQILSSGFVALTHGMNDAQKVMGVITLALFTSGKINSINVPVWVKLLCAVAMALGTAAGGWKVIRTLGTKLAHIRPVEGFAAETAAGLVLSIAAAIGVPVSTTHTITGSILGVGSAYRARAVKWGIGKKIIYAWVFTLPVTAIISGILGFIFR
ncbi:MAG: inorganic phosphate transporter [Thermoguttaceae bacterium]|jgi:PiT family inorganic phosphate transporter